MIRLENNCVGCEKACIYDACPYYREEVHCCDRCNGYTTAVYRYEGWDYCKDCLSEELDYQFGRLSVEEKIEALMLEDEIEEV